MVTRRFTATSQGNQYRNRPQSAPVTREQDEMTAFAHETPHQRSNRHRRVASIVIPVLYLLGGALFYQSGGAWWPLQAIGVAMWIVASVWVMSLSTDAAKFEEKKANGEVLPDRVPARV